MPGKSTLVDAFLNQSGVFRANEEIVDCVMYSDDIERERGITIYSKNCSIMHNGVKINIVDTPGHADFSSEVERIMKTVDTVILLVDSSEGPMPQTRSYSKNHWNRGSTDSFYNKLDKKDAASTRSLTRSMSCSWIWTRVRSSWIFRFSTGSRGRAWQSETRRRSRTYWIGEGENKIKKSPQGLRRSDLTPLFDTIIEHCQPYPDLNEEPLQLQVSTLAYDDYIGRLGIGRITKGIIKEGQTVAVAKADGSIATRKVNQVFVYRGLKRMAVPQAECAIRGGIRYLGYFDRGDNL